MRTASDFYHSRIRCDWLKRLENLTHAPGRSHHRADDLFFASANVFRLALLVSKLTLKRALREFSLRRLSPTHYLCFLALIVGAALRGRPCAETQRGNLGGR
jgi:hypothetical protein